MILISRLIGGRQQCFRFETWSAAGPESDFHVTILEGGGCVRGLVAMREAHLLVAELLEKQKGPSGSFEGRMRCRLPMTCGPELAVKISLPLRIGRIIHPAQ
jgi:hypothetical protein